MAEPTQTRKSNADRGLELHANPEGPGFPLLKSCPERHVAPPEPQPEAKPRRRKKKS